MGSSDQDVLTATEAARLVGRPKDAVRNAIRDGSLTGSNIKGRWYVERELLLAWDRRTARRQRAGSQPWETTAGLLGDYGPATTEELAVLRGLHPGNVRKHLAILAVQGRAKRLDDSQWVLTGADVCHRPGAA